MMPGDTPEKPDCASCRYGTTERSGNGPVTVGERQITCRRYPPVPLAVPAPGGIQVLNAFPVVQPGQWCGEYLGPGGGPLVAYWPLEEDDRPESTA